MCSRALRRADLFDQGGLLKEPCAQKPDALQKREVVPLQRPASNNLHRKPDQWSNGLLGWDPRWPGYDEPDHRKVSSDAARRERERSDLPSSARSHLSAASDSSPGLNPGRHTLILHSMLCDAIDDRMHAVHVQCRTRCAKLHACVRRVAVGVDACMHTYVRCYK